MGANTAVGAKAAKIWGNTTCVWQGSYAETHFIFANKDGYCSRHNHADKFNRFYVVSGRLQVTIYKGDYTEDTILEPGQITDVPPGLDHRFIALEDTAAIEIYWVNELRGDDIVRKDDGGISEFEELGKRVKKFEKFGSQDIF